MAYLKDEALNQLATATNVAQFVSFAPDGAAPKQRFSRVLGHKPNHIFTDLYEASETLIKRSSGGKVNIRSFKPTQYSGNKFVMNVETTSEVIEAVEKLSLEGFFTIINENIDIHDGGVSGVMSGDLIEFAPDDTPRCVERPGTALLSKLWAQKILKIVYGIEIDVFLLNGRVEFSLHPEPCGWRRDHTICWEWAENESGQTASNVGPWPNRFSKLIGDKVYGLLIALCAGLPVPKTTFIGRRIKPFTFGLETGSKEVWVRTCPAEPEPGRFTTSKGWIDPFALLKEEDNSRQIASVISQAAVPAICSGAALKNKDGEIVVEGVFGEGDRLMLGLQKPQPLPKHLVSMIENTYFTLKENLGDVRFEWVYDGATVWIVQLHLGKTDSTNTVVVPGDPLAWVDFDVAKGLNALREVIENLESGRGIRLIGEIGITSHIADLMRRTKIPTRRIPI